MLNMSRTTRTVLTTACALAFLGAAPQATAADWHWGWGKSEQVQGNGTIKRQARDLAHFSGLTLSLQGEVEVHTGAGPESVTVETDDNLLPLVETVVEDGMLKIRAKRDTNLRTRHLKFIVQTRGLDRVAVAGSGTVDADAVRGARIKFDVGGSGTIKVHRLEGESVSVNLAGSGDLKGADGSVRNISISVGGSGSVDLAHVRSETASVTVAGSGDAALWVRDSLSLTVAGSGDVDYYGDPHVSTSVVGSGKVRRLGAAPQ